LLQGFLDSCNLFHSCGWASLVCRALRTVTLFAELLSRLPSKTRQCAALKVCLQCHQPQLKSTPGCDLNLAPRTVAGSYEVRTMKPASMVGWLATKANQYPQIVLLKTLLPAPCARTHHILQCLPANVTEGDQTKTSKENRNNGSSPWKLGIDHRKAR